PVGRLVRRIRRPECSDATEAFHRRAEGAGPMSKMRFLVMDVGQGSANFVQYYSDVTAPATNAGLIDIGSEAWKEEAGEPSAKLIAQELKKMNANEATLAHVMLSHSDSDHHNLGETLLKQFHKPSSKQTPSLAVNRTWYGGSYALYEKHGENVLDSLVSYRPRGATKASALREFKTPWSSFDDDDKTNWKPVAKVGAVELWVLAANTTGAGVSVKGVK